MAALPGQFILLKALDVLNETFGIRSQLAVDLLGGIVFQAQ